MSRARVTIRRRRVADLARLPEALAALLAARSLLRVGGLSRLERLSRRLAADGARRTPEIDALRWAVDAMANRFGGECLPRAFALQWLLARRGVSSELCIGIPSHGDPLPGHAWLEVAGNVVIGGPVPEGTSVLRRITCR